MSVDDLCDALPSMSLDRPVSPDSEQRLITVRALITSEEAHDIIASESSTDIFDQTSAFVYISQGLPKVPDRVLMVSGPADDVLEVCAFINHVRTFGSAPSPSESESPPIANTSIRLLISKQFIPDIIGLEGCKIKEIIAASGADINRERRDLPRSTEQIVEVVGTLEGIDIAIEEIGRCLPEEWEVHQDTVLYEPLIPDTEPSKTKNAQESPPRPLSLDEVHRFFTVRALLTSEEALGIIGSNSFKSLIDQTDVFVQIGLRISTVPHRVLMVHGPATEVLEVCAFINHFRLFGYPPSSFNSGSPPITNTSIRLLVSKQFMPNIIGPKGCKIKEIIDASGTIINKKEDLPRSTEKVVEVVGTLEGIGIAIEEISRCLPDDWEFHHDTVLYRVSLPNNADPFYARNRVKYKPKRPFKYGNKKGYWWDRGSREMHKHNHHYTSIHHPATPPHLRRSKQKGKKVQAPPSPPPPLSPNPSPTSILIPSNLVKYITGQDGNLITEIESWSGTLITIEPEPQGDGEMCVCDIRGTSAAIENALQLICQQLTQEKERRSREGSST